jgi:chorismate dehydratase
MIRLGHIDYSNCVPVHALLLAEPQPGIELVRGTPAELNSALAAGTIDAAPCSSIEYARHPGEYRILPGPAIGAAGAVQSILLESTVPLDRLGDCAVAVPTASATSVVLLRALLELRLDVRPRLEWYEQSATADPIADGAVAALRIGDVALTRQAPADRLVFDLGSEWADWVGLPFAFAVWQVRRELDPVAVARLTHLLYESREYYVQRQEQLAEEYAPRFALVASRLLDYWRSLCFDFDAPMQRGLLHFYTLANQLGEAPHARFLDIADSKWEADLGS